jgi:lysozyme|tara:strand:+ start:999 stop:1439 length:441 start_codon:yes stop_codon:yes gene_type:complete
MTTVFSQDFLDEITDTLKRHEGVRQYTYRCPAGYWTIGAGRNIDEKGGRGLSDDEIDYLLQNDIQISVNELVDAFPWFEDSLTQIQSVLINMHFNMGMPTLRKFRNMLDAMERKDYGHAADEMLDSHWADQVGDRATELSDIVRQS